MRFHSNSSNKDGKQIVEAKVFIIFSSLETGCDLCLQRLSNKSTEKLLKKTKLKNPNLFWKSNYFIKYNRLKITTKSDG